LLLSNIKSVEIWKNFSTDFFIFLMFFHFGEKIYPCAYAHKTGSYAQNTGSYAQ